VSWPTMPFEDLYECPSRNGLNRPSRVRGAGFKMINMGELFAHDRISNIEMERVQLNDAELSSMLVAPGDLLFARQSLVLAGAGKCSIVVDASEPTTFESHLIRVRLKRDIAEPLFFHYYFKSPDAGMKSIVTQGVQAGIRGSDLKRLPVRVPPRFEQERIAHTLAAYDDLIENNRRRIALLEEAARMLYREWFVHFRFPSHEHVKIVDGLPEGWERTTLGQVAETNRESYGAKELPEQINYINISSVAQGRIVSKTTLSSNDAPRRARRKARDGDVIWSNVRPNLRAYALVLQPEEADVFSTGFTVLSGKSVPFSWLYLFVTTDNFVGHLVNHATGAGYPAVRPDDFERAAVVLPSEGLLKHFHEASEPNFRLISKLEQQNQQLAQARDLLLPRLMNGEIAV
jgi:type I restriction enzyme, S subunit